MGIDAAAADRLPWLSDDCAPRPIDRRRFSPLAWAAATGAVLLGAAGLWIGVNVLEKAAGTAQPMQATTTVQLPPPHEPRALATRSPAQMDLHPAPAPEVRPSPLQQVEVQPPAGSAARQSASGENNGQEVVPQVSGKPAAPAGESRGATQSLLPRPWKPSVVRGASGRLVQVGAFGSVRRSKHGWSLMVHDYPPMAQLPSLVVETRNSKGFAFYRFDVGTTSSDQSEILCQRMRRIGLGCAVIGLPRKATVER